MRRPRRALFARFALAVAAMFLGGARTVHADESVSIRERFALDFKVNAAYHSPGREYSELFDALGTSRARSLRDPNHRPVIDLPGRRFSVDDTTIVDLRLSAVAMF